MSMRKTLPPGASWDVLGPPEASWALLGSPGASWGLLGPPGHSASLLGLPGASWGLVAPRPMLDLFSAHVFLRVLRPTTSCWISPGRTFLEQARKEIMFQQKVSRTL